MDRYEGTLIQAIWSRRYWFFLWILVSAFAATILVWNYPPQYLSKAQIYVNAALPTEPLVEGQFQEPIPEVKRVFHLLTSTQVLDHVIDKVQLMPLKAKGVSSGRARVSARIKLLKQIDVKFLDGNAMEITVRSRERDVAPRIANLICQRVIALTEKRSREAISRSKMIHDRVFKGLMAQSARTEKRLLALLSSTRDASMSDQRRERLESEYDRLLGQVARDQQEMFNVQKVQQVSASLLLKDISDPITIIRSADPDLTTDPWFDAVLLVAGFVSLSALVYMMVLVMWLKRRNSIRADWLEFITLDGTKMTAGSEESHETATRWRKEDPKPVERHASSLGDQRYKKEMTV